MLSFIRWNFTITTRLLGTMCSIFWPHSSSIVLFYYATWKIFSINVKPSRSRVKPDFRLNWECWKQNPEPLITWPPEEWVRVIESRYPRREMLFVRGGRSDIEWFSTISGWPLLLGNQKILRLFPLKRLRLRKLCGGLRMNDLIMIFVNLFFKLPSTF